MLVTVKRAASIFILAASIVAQAPTFQQGNPPATAKPSVLTIPGGGTSCTVTGNTFPATQITVGACTFGGVTIPSFTIPNTVTIPWAITYQINSGTNASTFILSVTSTTPFTIQATVNASPAVGGTF